MRETEQNSQSTLRHKSQAMAVNVILGVLATTQVVAGGANLDQTWGIMVLCAGAIMLPVVVFGIARQAWAGPMAIGQVLLAALLIAVGATQSEVMLAVGGVIMLALAGSTQAIIWSLPQRAPATARAAPAGINAPAIERLLNELQANGQMSETARRILFRDRDIALISQAIGDCIARGDFPHAASLCDDLETVYEQTEIANQHRATIENAGLELHEHRLANALEEFDQMLEASDWPRAHQYVSQLQQMFGQSIVDANLVGRIEDARAAHKADLERQFLHAAQHDDTASAMALLKHLDQYLTRDEAVRLNEVADGVVVRHREGLSAQFRQAVGDHRWEEAAAVGDRIINEFPNTKMAREVRSMIDVLRTRATASAVAAHAERG